MRRDDRDENRNRNLHRDVGRQRYPGSEWGRSSEFGRNSEFDPSHRRDLGSRYRESDSYDRYSDRPFDMDNYYSGRQFSVGGTDYDLQDHNEEWDSSRFSEGRDVNRSRFAEPYTGGEFSRNQYGTGSRYSDDRFDHQSRGYGSSGQRDREWGRAGEFGSRDSYGRGYENRGLAGEDFRNDDRGFSGKGPKGYKRSDERIREDACEALYRNPYIDASDIDVAVKDGQVTLRGTVESRNAKREAESCIENLSGVDDVQNELRLKRSDLGISSGVTGKNEKGNDLNGGRKVS